MKVIIPQKLKKGDRVGVVSPAGASVGSKIEDLVNALSSLDLVPVVHSQNYKDIGYLAGTDEERAEALHDFFKDEDIKGIFCVRGGYGCARILDKLDYDLIRNNPKILVGMSDITALQSALLVKAGLESYHGPMSLHFKGAKNKFAIENMKSILFDSEEEIDLLPDCICGEGFYSGNLIGGNLSVMGDLIGTEYFFNCADSILLIEEVEEWKYAIDRKIMQLKYAGVLDSVKAIIVGQNIYKDGDTFAYSMLEILKNALPNKNIPVVIGAKFGHGDYHLTLPIGRNVTLSLKNSKAKLIL